MQNEEVTLIPVTSADVVYQQDKAMIDMQIATAKAYPRNVKKATENIIALVTMDQETAEKCNYALPRGGKSITGPSVHLAKIIAQSWGNLRAESKVVDISATQVTSEAVCFDLETNVAIKVQVKRSITGKSGRFNDDMITVTGNAANSIALRNAVFAVVPTSVRDKAYKAAIKTITGDLSTEYKLIAKRKTVMDALTGTYNVTEAEVLASIGKAALSHLTAQDITVLIGIGQAIKDGDTTVEEQFRPDKLKPATKTAAEKESERFLSFIAGATTLEKLSEVSKHFLPDTPGAVLDAYEKKRAELESKTK